ncbi:MAG: glycosyltransferase family 9 protein, partial [Chloroflexaceae bacterium]|nr:glycosyltransferase family 9 protein [Chloroflexaceae bacterium]
SRSRGIRHEVRRQLDLVAAIGCTTSNERLSLRVPPAARQHIPPLLNTHGIDPTRPWVVLHPGATASSRRYPVEHMAAVAQQLVGDNIQIVFTGTAPEAELVAALQAQMHAPSCSLVGRLDLGELAALIEQAPLLIANNTGTVHIAAALGTPVVVLYALTNPQHTPWQTPQRVLFHDVPCKYCYKSICPAGHHHCLRLVEPAAVVDAAHDLLAGVPASTMFPAEVLA